MEEEEKEKGGSAHVQPGVMVSGPKNGHYMKLALREGVREQRWRQWEEVQQLWAAVNCPSHGLWPEWQVDDDGPGHQML